MRTLTVNLSAASGVAEAMNDQKLVSAEELRSLLSYDKESGDFTWIKSRGRMKSGQIAGVINGPGYSIITINRVQYLAHRLAWLYVNGEWPPQFIDHINGVRADNRLSNLRSVSHKENLRNQAQRSNNKSGCTGVYWIKASGKWQVFIRGDGKNVHVGMFDNFEDAVNARKKAEHERGFHKNHGRKENLPL